MSNSKPFKLSHDELAEVIGLTPLVSIDLIIEDGRGKILVGMRNNEPARGYWFVPGGRIFKNERIAEAFERITKEELGFEIHYDQAELLGAFDHIYDTNFAKLPGLGTQYVVLAHRVKLQGEIKIKPDAQHSEMRWLDKNEILADQKVHPNTKAYFEMNLRGLIAKE